jgi:pimeloyl-ACP methyl ester carboxylesterase
MTHYRPRHPARSETCAIRNLQQHLLHWGDDVPVRDDQPSVVMLHGWMDVAASFQFVVDAWLDQQGRHIVALDWRGFGQTRGAATDSYWFPDYLADLDAVLDLLSPGQAVDLIGHSMGGNVAMSYAGVRPKRVRRLINLEGFGLPGAPAEQAPKRMAQWLDQLRTPQSLKPYASVDAVAQRLMQNNPRIPADQAHWLAEHWAAPSTDGQWHIQADPAHKRPNPIAYRVDEILAHWAAIQAPTLVVEAEQTDVFKYWPNYTMATFHERLAVVPQVERVVMPNCGHMLHHDQPAALAELIRSFLN